jgi:hypothetical protein
MVPTRFGRSNYYIPNLNTWFARESKHKEIFAMLDEIRSKKSFDKFIQHHSA